MSIKTKLWINGFVFVALAILMVLYSLSPAYHPDWDVEIFFPRHP